MQFSLKQFLMAISLVAIFLLLMRSEGCGQRFTKIGCIEFSPNGQTLLVSKYNARDALVPLKGYLQNISRTISLVESKNGAATFVDQQIRSANSGPAFKLYRYVRKAADFVDDDTLAIRSCDGSSVKIQNKHHNNEVITIKADHPIMDFRVFNDASQLFVAGYDFVTLFDLSRDKPVQLLQVEARDVAFSGGPAFSVSSNGALLATSYHNEVQIHEIATGKKVHQIQVLPEDQHVESVTFLPGDQQLVVVSWEQTGILDVSNSEFKQIAPGWSNADVSVSKNGGLLAVPNGSKVELFEINQGIFQRQHVSKRLIETDAQVTGIHLSPDGKRLAVGDYHGNLTMIDTATEQVLWKTSPPGRTRPAWTIPIVFLALWGYAFLKLFVKPDRAQARAIMHLVILCVLIILLIVLLMVPAIL